MHMQSGLPVIVNRFTSIDGTERFLLRLADGESVESVLIPRENRVTFCISSQVGCALGCTFCLTGQLGLSRDLSADEIISQVRLLFSVGPTGQATVGTTPGSLFGRSPHALQNE